MSQRDTTDRTGRLEVSEFPGGDLSKLAELARQAYEQKGTKECLDLTRAMLLIDPDNADAQRLRSLIQSEMHQDLENARAFLRNAQPKEKSEKQSQPSLAAVPAGFPLHAHAEGAALSPSTGTVGSPSAPGDSNRMPKARWLVGAGVVIVLALTVAALPRFRTESNPVQPSPLMSRAPESSGPVSNGDAQPNVLNTSSAEVAMASTTGTAPASAAAPRSAENSPDSLIAAVRVPAPASRPAAGSADSSVVAAPDGTLAISSTTSVDIYKDDAYLGSVPVSLALPAGPQTLEYRHGNLRKNVTHIINSNETTRAMITFDVGVQINSRPWAEVFVDGVDRRALGQTPLSGVRVPIGSVLIFENPQFQPKRYRVTGNETGIQIVFP